jgi:GNAT superfamily N-acetyltransferase
MKQHIDIEKIKLRKAIVSDKPIVVGFDYRLDKNEHIKLNREEKIEKAISNGECFLILADEQEIGFVIFDYRFFDLGWIELIVLDEKYRGKGIGGKTLGLISELCKADKVFTSTNRSNIQMQRALNKAYFSFAGELNGLDDGDPEFFYYKKLNKTKKLRNK